MVRRLVGAKPLSEPMLEYFLIKPLRENFTEMLIDIHIFSFKNLQSTSLQAMENDYVLKKSMIIVIYTWK